MQISLRILLAILVICLSAWVGLLIFTHLPFGEMLSFGLIILWLVITFAYLIRIFKPNFLAKLFLIKKLSYLFYAGFAIALGVFFALTPSNQRDWLPENAQMLDFKLANDGKTITLYNVRNFDWHSKTDYRPNWETRQYDLDKLQSLDLIASYWMGDKIAHTLVSFGFSDGQRVAFSIEIRKEQGEDFSTFGGFFRNYELLIIAADEKDIIYTRSNVRHEDVYIYPLVVPQTDLKPLFLAYANKARALKNKPEWYNSLTNNCTTAMYPLFNSLHLIPFEKKWDYRWIESGHFPDYLYEQNLVSHKFDFATWHNKAYINPKSDKFSNDNPISSSDYSALIRQDF